MRKISLLAFASVLAPVLMLGACAMETSQGLPLAQMTFAEVQSIPVNVRIFNVTGGDRAARPDDFIIDPGKAAQEYLGRRFSGAGANGGLHASIELASVTKGHEESANSVASYFNVGGADIYHVIISVRFEHSDNNGNVVYGKVITARRDMHITEHASIAEREQAEMDGMGELFKDIDVQVRPLVLQDMGLGR